MTSESILAITVPADSRIRLRERLDTYPIPGFRRRGGCWDDGSTTWVEYVEVPEDTTPAMMARWVRDNVRRDECSVRWAIMETEA